MTYDDSTTRRTFLGGAAALLASTLVPCKVAAASGKPNSVFNGVRIGTISYSYRSTFTTAEETLGGLLEDGLSEVELMGGPIELYAGLRSARPRGKRPGLRAPSPFQPVPTAIRNWQSAGNCANFSTMRV